MGIRQNGRVLMRFPEEENVSLSPLAQSVIRASLTQTHVLHDKPFAWKTGNRENVGLAETVPESGIRRSFRGLSRFAQSLGQFIC